MINWREKFVAFGIHLVATLLLAGAAAALIFLVWYPRPFDDMVGGSKLFLLIVGSDIVLGPLISLVIYDSRKSRRALVIDYVVVGLVQTSAVVYGVAVMSDTRPAYVAFVNDRFEVVSAGDIPPEELAAARDPLYGSLPRWGPRLVGTRVPQKDRDNALDMALKGRDVSLRPKFYVPFESVSGLVRKRSRPIAQLLKRHPEATPLVEDAARENHLDTTRLRWLPTQHGITFWTALVDADSGRPVAYVSLDPY